MAVPRNRTSNARKNSRRSHHAKKAKATSVCTNCGVSKLPHTICDACGTYNNKIVISKAVAE